MLLKKLLILFFCIFLNLPSGAIKKTAPQRQLYWKTYNLTDEGNYVLRLRNNTDLPIKDLISNLHIYIPSNSFIKQNQEDIQNIFMPSTGEYLMEVNLLKVLSEEGFNISLRSHSFVYILHNKKLKAITNLEVYKLGPAKPYLSYKY